MEEDIKEILIALDNTTKKQLDKAIENADKEWSEMELEEDIKILENAISDLIKENKELKHITQNFNAYQQKSYNPNSTIIIADEKWFINGYFKENFIPKSKVKEKIEELKDGTYDAKIILQQLLED